MAQNRTLFNSVVRNNVNSLKEGIEQQKLDVNMRSEETGSTALKIAVGKNNINIIKMLLVKYKADPNIGDNHGITPLQSIVLQFKDTAKKNKDVCFEIAELLLNSGADPDAKNKQGETPFFWVKDGMTPDVIRMRALLERYRKRLDLTEVSPIHQPGAEQISPAPPPRRNKSWPMTEKEANLDENAEDNAPLLSSNQYSSFGENATKDAKGSPDSGNKKRPDNDNCILM